MVDSERIEAAQTCSVMITVQKFIRIGYALGIMIFLSANSASAANWVVVAKSAFCDISVDAHSLLKRDDLLQCWVLFDYHSASVLPDGKVFYSSESLYEIDTSKRVLKILSSYSYADKGGTGMIVCSGNEDLWQPLQIPPGSAAESIMKYVLKVVQNDRINLEQK
jgi:hypothetical protein